MMWRKCPGRGRQGQSRGRSISRLDQQMGKTREGRNDALRACSEAPFLGASSLVDLGAISGHALACGQEKGNEGSSLRLVYLGWARAAAVIGKLRSSEIEVILIILPGLYRNPSVLDHDIRHEDPDVFPTLKRVLGLRSLCRFVIPKPSDPPRTLAGPISSSKPSPILHQHSAARQVSKRASSVAVPATRPSRRP